MTTALQSQARVLLLREVATSPVAATFVAERQLDEGSRLVAVKVLKRDADAAIIVGLQENSARLGALNQRHIVCPEQVLEIDGHLGLLYPYVDGVDLLDWVEVLRETNTRMPPRVVCEVLRGVAVALDAALNRIPWGETRALQILHCDLKPSNVMVDRDGELKVLDFGTGTSRLGGRDTESVPRSARAYVAPERELGRPPSHAADMYALGLLGIELLGDRWLRTVPRANPDHDLYLGQAIRHADFTMRSAADEQTLRSLLLRMCAYSPASRPTAAAAAQTFRRLADRAPGPSLEAFAHEHALPWVTHAPEDPDTALMVQVTPVTVDVTGQYPILPRETPEEDTNTMSLGDLSSLLENDPTHIFIKDTAWDDAEASVTESIAEETEKALLQAREIREATGAFQRRQRPRDAEAPRPVDLTGRSQRPQELEFVTATEPSVKPVPRPPLPRDEPPPPAFIDIADADVEVLGPVDLPPRISADPPTEEEPRRSLLLPVVGFLAMLTGAGIAVGALVVGAIAGALLVLWT
ncbi:MAG: protein kinase [Alphaproteobacteria bacterium]|nr:protein kinase [Alphaproteobacteria bacterium]